MQARTGAEIALSVTVVGDTIHITGPDDLTTVLTPAEARELAQALAAAAGEARIQAEAAGSKSE